MLWFALTHNSGILFIYYNLFSDLHLFLKDGKYREALGKWEAALNLVPESAVLHEQKSQVLLEIGDAWNALKAAARASHCLFPTFLPRLIHAL